MPPMVHVPREQGDQQQLETGADNSTRTSGGDKKCQKWPWVKAANLRMRSPHKTNFIHIANALTAAIRCAVAWFCHPGRAPGHGAAGMRGTAGLSGLSGFQHWQGETVPTVVGVMALRWPKLLGLLGRPGRSKLPPTRALPNTPTIRPRHSRSHHQHRHI